MKPIEPGCLAMVVKARNPANLGITVRVIRRAPKDEPNPDLMPPPVYEAWLCESTGRHFVNVISRTWDDALLKLDPNRLAFVRLDGLIRLDPDADTEPDADSIPNSPPKEIPA